MNTDLLQQARVLNIDEQIELVEAIWDGIVSHGDAPSLTEAQKRNLTIVSQTTLLTQMMWFPGVK